VRNAAHRPDIVDRIERGDAAIIIRIVNNRREEINRLDQREVVAKAIYSRVVSRLDADNQIGILRYL